MRTLDQVFARLEGSPFRQRFHLGEQERRYLEERGLATVLKHARGFIEARLAPEQPVRDGKQTPYRGHPVFVAQHATACCCRGCLEKWHDIPRGHRLSEAECQHILAGLERWLQRALEN